LSIPTILTSIIVTALSKEAYLHGCEDGSTLEQYLFEDQPILRQGDVLGVPSKQPTTSDHVETLQYRLEMVEPVLQGLANRGETKIILLASQDDPSAIDIDSLEDISEEQDDQDDFEIDEEFLGSSVINTSGSSQIARNHGSQSGQLNGHVEECSLGLQPKPLTCPSGLSEDDRTLYLRTTDMGRLGVLSGYWVSRPKSIDKLDLLTRRLSGNRQCKDIEFSPCSHRGK
jgi:peroxin-6